MLKEILSALSKTKEQGHSTVSIDAIENYLKQIYKDVESEEQIQKLDFESKLVQFKAENDRNIAHSNNQTAHSIEMFKSVITAGQAALKASMIINGGAAVALLAFAGKIWETSTTALVANSLVESNLIFCFGVLCAALASGTTYISQYSYANNCYKAGHIFTSLSILLALCSYFLFGYGSYSASSSLGNHFGL